MRSFLPMNITIRAEQKEDYDKIYDLIKIAFQSAKVSDGDEQDFAVSLRGSKSYINELALVAQIGDQIVGHIMFTKMVITHHDGCEIPSLLVAPLAVKLEYRGAGIGGALMKRGFEIARDMGYITAVLCGDPNYYCRFGFVQASTCGIIHSSDLPSIYVMCCRLNGDDKNDISGTITII